MIATDRWAKTALGAAIVALVAIAALFAAVVPAAIVLPFLLGTVRSAAAANSMADHGNSWQPLAIGSIQPNLHDRFNGSGNDSHVASNDVDLVVDGDVDLDDEDDGQNIDADVAIDSDERNDLLTCVDSDIDADTDLDDDNDSEDEPLDIDLL